MNFGDQQGCTLILTVMRLLNRGERLDYKD